MSKKQGIKLSEWARNNGRTNSAAHHQKKAGRLPTAYIDADGQWSIPAGTKWPTPRRSGRKAAQA